MTDATAPTGTGDAGGATAGAASTPSTDTSAAAVAPAPAAPAPAAPAAAAPAAPTPTLAEGGSPSGATGDTTVAAAAAATPQQSWRERIAGDDKDFLNTLNRFASEADFGKAYRAAQRKISEGAHKKPGPPENATPEDLAAWRKEAGLPESWEKYNPQLPDGLVLGTEDKPVVDLFAQFAHNQNWSEQQFNDVLGFYYQTQDALQSMRQDADQQFAINAEDTLRREYGADYRRNMNALGNFRDKMPEGLATRLLAGRMADGTLIGNDPHFISWAIATALDMDPTATIVPAGTADAGRAIGDEIAQIETTMKTDPPKYWKDEAMQARYRDLLSARNQMKSRAA